MLLTGNVKGMLEAVEQEERLCDEVETVQDFTYLGDNVENVRLLLLPEQDDGGVGLVSTVSCCILKRLCTKAERGCLEELRKASNFVLK